jgi:hypothetical protein
MEAFAAVIAAAAADNDDDALSNEEEQEQATAAVTEPQAETNENEEENQHVTATSSALATPAGHGCESDAEVATGNDAYDDCEAADGLDAAFVPAIVAQTASVPSVPLEKQLKESAAAGRWSDVKQLLPRASGVLEFAHHIFLGSSACFD